VFIAGYWDWSVAERGVLYAPVVIHPAMAGPTFVYTPAYAIRETMLLDTLFVRPSWCHYYFGDYYGPRCHQLGFESCVVYSRRHYDAIFVYERYAHRSDPRWEAAQLDMCLARHAGRAPCPPRTLAQQNSLLPQNVANLRNVPRVNPSISSSHTVVNSSQLVIPATQLAAAKGIRTVPLDKSEQIQAKQQAQAIQQIGLQRHQIEVKASPGTQLHPRTAALNVTPMQPLATRPTAAPGLHWNDSSQQATISHASATPTAAGVASPQAGNLPVPGNRRLTDPPAAVRNLPIAQPSEKVDGPALSSLPNQPIPLGKSPTISRPTPLTTAGSSAPRAAQPGVTFAPNGQIQRLSPDQQPRPVSPPKKPDPSEKQPPASEQKPS
jgi:hypothetical protein